MKIISAWGYPSNPFYNPERANNGGGYWRYYGGVVIDHNGKLVVLELQDDDCGDFSSRGSFDVDAPGYWWHANCGTSDDASIDTPEDIEAVCASIDGVLGLDIMELIHEVAPVIDECARRQWQALAERKNEMNESVSAVTPVALWWTGDNIEIYEIDGELVALYGWNGEQWTDCWRCIDRYTAADDECLTVRPTYRGQVEACDDENTAAEIVNLKII